MEIAQALPTDYDVIRRLDCQSFPKDEQWPDEWMTFMLTSPENQVWVMYQPGRHRRRILGYMLGWSTDDHTWYVASIVVAPQARGKGIGDMLLNLPLPYSTWTADIRHTNIASQRLFTRNGFFTRVHSEHHSMWVRRS